MAKQPTQTKEPHPSGMDAQLQEVFASLTDLNQSAVTLAQCLAVPGEADPKLVCRFMARRCRSLAVILEAEGAESGYFCQ